MLTTDAFPRFSLTSIWQNTNCDGCDISLFLRTYCKKKKITNFNVDNIDKDSNLINFVLSLVLRLSNRIHDNLFDKTNSLKKIKHIINISSTIQQHNINSWITCLDKSSVRQTYIDKGIEYAELFLNYKVN